MKSVNYQELSQKQKELLNSAEQAMKTAYNPYSGFSVGAALSSGEEIITGSNVENASYGGTICAERSAIVRANSLNIRKFDAVAIIGKGEDFDSLEVVSPCGFCRQVIFEFSQVSGKDIEVIMSNTKKDKITIAKISELLPLGFGPKDINVDINKYQK